MNRIKGNKQRIVIGISVILLLCGFPMILLSRGADNFPHDIGTNLGVLMGMIGGGGIGTVIGMHFSVRRSHRLHKMSQDTHCNQLKRKAKKDFLFICMITIAAYVGIGFLTHVDIKGAMGARYLIFSLVFAGLSVGIMIFLNTGKHKNQYAPVFDEREFSLIQRAVFWGHIAFITFAGLAMFTAFYLVGGHGTVPMWSIPVGFFGSLFAAGLIEFLVLSYHAREDEKITEGGAA